jgi:hypothetical protein
MDEDFGFKARQVIQVVYQHHGISIDLPHGDE